MKDAYYFSHDSNARHDPKIAALRSIYGYEGYGWYWAIIEILREDKNFKFPLEKLQLLGLCKELDTNIEKLNNFLEVCIQLDLMQIDFASEGDKKFLTCRGLNLRMNKYKQISIARSKAASIRWDSNRKHANAMQMHSKCIANSMQTHAIKLNEMKVNEIKEYKSTDTPVKTAFKKPSITEIQEYCAERNNNINPTQFHAYYESVGWKVGNKPMKSWKSAIITWECRNKNKPVESNELYSKEGEL